MNIKLKIAAFILLFIAILFLAFNRHSKRNYYTYHSEIWADKAGYYMYLPGAIKFDFEPDKFPDAIDIKTGNGFKLDYENKKVLTKYTYGVALLQLPFFLIADISARSLGMSANGFSPVYHWSINVAAVFYLLLGMFFLKRFLSYYFQIKTIYIVLFFIFTGTNLYYYSIDDSGMSHVYSFAMFSLYLLLIKTADYGLKTARSRIFLLGIVGGLIIIIRPSNVIFLAGIFFLDTANRRQIIDRIRNLLNGRIFFFGFFGALVIMIPQLLYWKHTYGTLINYSYGNERFEWLDPKLIQVWFAPNNGLFLYSPMFLFILASLILMAKNRSENGFMILALFLLISYIFSCWWDRSFGCSFGARSYVEYLSLFSIPLCYFLERYGKTQRRMVLICTLLLLFSIFNLKLTYTYDVCFRGVANWDWISYLDLVTAPTK